MQSPTVLVADSDPLQRQMIELLLAEFTVVSFDNGQEALEYFQTHTPALAIFAARMPDINGTDICGRIKSIKRLRHIPIIITTSQQRYGTVKDLARAVRADLVLPRPLEDQDLATQVRGLIDPESFLTPVEVKDGEAIERALERLETQSTRQLADEGELKDLLSANQNLHRQLEVLKQDYRQLKEDTLTEEEVKRLRSSVETLRKENEALKQRVAATENYDTLSLDLESLKKDYADLQAQVAEQPSKEAFEQLQAELATSKDDYATLERDFENLKERYAELERQASEKSDPKDVEKLQADLEAATTNYEVLQLNFEKLNQDYFNLKAQVDEQSDPKEVEKLQAKLEAAREEQRRLSTQLAEIQADPEKVIYHGEDETLQVLEFLRNKQSIQERQLDTLRKHNQKLLASINEMQLNQSSRKSLLDRFRS